jgi:hypothetical protein
LLKFRVIAYIGFGGTQFQLKSVANDTEGPEKYNNFKVKYGVTFNSFQTALDTSCGEV